MEKNMKAQIGGPAIDGAGFLEEAILKMRAKGQVGTNKARECIKGSCSQVEWPMPLILALRRQRQVDLCESKANLL